MFFGFTQCPDVCPTTLTLLAQMKKQLADLPAAQQPRVLLISVDPERDTPAVLKPYVTFFDPSFRGATGTLEGVQHAATAFGVPFQKMPLPDGGYTMDHGAGCSSLHPMAASPPTFSPPLAAEVLRRDFRKVVQLFEEAPMTVEIERSGSDELFALLQKVLPQHLLSRGMHALARSRQPVVRNAILRTVLRSYPQIDMHEALQPDPFAYESFNAFFTRELRPGARPIAGRRAHPGFTRSTARSASWANRPMRAAAAGEGHAVHLRGPDGRRAVGRALPGRQLRVPVPGALQLSPHPHAVRRRPPRDALRAGPAVLSERRDCSRRARSLRPQ